MRHPRRRDSDDPEFVEIKEFSIKPDAPIQIADVIERFDGDADRVARDLIQAANEASGKDDINDGGASPPFDHKKRRR
jgi:hypothetical protein